MSRNPLTTIYLISRLMMIVIVVHSSAYGNVRLSVLAALSVVSMAPAECFSLTGTVLVSQHDKAAFKRTGPIGGRCNTRGQNC
jgi:hypothetical protein